MAEIRRLLTYRYGGPRLPDDDSGRDDLRVVCQILATTSEPEKRITAFAAAWAPWMQGGDLQNLVDYAVAHPRRFKPDTIATKLGVTAETRQKLRLWTLGATDETSAQRMTRRAEQKRQRAEQRRRAAGVPSKAELAGRGKIKLEPWVALGISRATWFRRCAVKREAASPCPTRSGPERRTPPMPPSDRGAS